MFKIVMKKNDLNRHKVGLIRLDTKFFFYLRWSTTSLLNCIFYWFDISTPEEFCTQIAGCVFN